MTITLPRCQRSRDGPSQVFLGLIIWLMARKIGSLGSNKGVKLRRPNILDKYNKDTSGKIVINFENKHNEILDFTE